MINPVDLPGKRILVTASTDGIGSETAVQLGRLSANVVAGGRDEEKVQEVFQAMIRCPHYTLKKEDVLSSP